MTSVLARGVAVTTISVSTVHSQYLPLKRTVRPTGAWALLAQLIFYVECAQLHIRQLNFFFGVLLTVHPDISA